MADGGIRINKYLSEVGHCSRRAADKLLEQGRITLNGVVPELGTKVMPGDTVEVEAEIDQLSARSGKGKGAVLLDGKVACSAEIMFVVVDA